MLHRHVTAVAATVVAASVFAVMDANPSLFFFDKLLARRRRLHQHYLSDQKMWIVGASSGIGASLAQELSASGASLILSARNEQNLQRVAVECRDCHPRKQMPLVVPLDMAASPDEVERTVDNVLLKAPQLDYVIFNAGIGQQSPAVETSAETSQKLMQVNALGIMNLSTLLLNKSDWLSRRKGHFVVTSSIAAKGGVPLSAAYAASKHAIHGYMQSLKAELPWLQVTLPCPGPVATNFHQTRTEKGELKMNVHRCARLMLSSILMGGGETWIAQQPTLTFMYLNQYLPSPAQRLLNKMGPMRVGMWKEGYNIYSPQDMRAYRKQRRRQQPVGTEEATQ